MAGFSGGVGVAARLPAASDAVPLDAEALVAAIGAANVPVLLCVLFQLTGERCWLEVRFRPTRPRGLDDHDDGGLSAETQAVVRRAAARAMLAWADGAPPAVPAPDHGQLIELMGLCMGEPVPAEYAPMVAEEMGFGAAQQPARVTAPVSVIVIGAGVSGMLAAHRLATLGCEVTVLEKNGQVGGTWLENRYPGCGVDTPSHLYEVSFVPEAWSVHFAKRDEIQRYMAAMPDRLGIGDRIRFGARVTALTYDSAARCWEVAFEDAGGIHRTSARYVIAAVGQLNRPRLPALPGLDRFGGTLCHSARWPDGLDVSRQRVAVIGSGATAMQLVPALAGVAARLEVYQRSPGWVAPNANYFSPIDAGVRWLMETVPFNRSWLRFRLAWTFNDKVHPSLVIDPAWPHPERAVNALNDVYRRYFTAYLEEQLAGRPDLIERCLPDYPPFGKRILIDNGWFTALRREDVALHTQRIEAITDAGVRLADGSELPAHVIVCATGFHAAEPLGHLTVRGRDGCELAEQWGRDDPRAFLGMATPGFPNLFFLYGPNTNLGHGGSYPTLAECQVRYLADLIAHAEAEAGGSCAIEVREEVHEAYNRAVDAAHAGLIWSHPGMDTWYRNSRGRVVANYPWRVIDYWQQTRTADLADFAVNGG
jgi:4-hydroxyacetophenone monooxygenase